MSTLKVEGLSMSRLATFATRHGLSPEETKLAGEAVFLSLCGRVVADGIVTDLERRNLERLARRLELDAARSAEILESAKVERLRSAADEAADDGTVTADEASDLEVLRRSLGVEENDGEEVVREAVAVSTTERSRRRRFVAGGAVAGLLAALPLWSQFWPERSASITANSATTIGEPDPAAPAESGTGTETASPRTSRPPGVPGRGSEPSSPLASVGEPVAETSSGGSHEGSVEENGYYQNYPRYRVPEPRYTPSRSTDGSGVVHVEGYRRKDGTYVRPHTRKAPAGKTSAPSYSRKTSRRR